MARLAIKGNKARGSEVLAILEMLGGKVSDGFTGAVKENVYYINERGFIDYIPYLNPNHPDFKIYTLNEFNEEYPYKPGDKVKVKAHPNEIVLLVGVLWESALCKLLYSATTPTNLTKFYTADELLPIAEEENMNITKILKDAPKGTKLYSPMYGDVKLELVANWGVRQIRVSFKDNNNETCMADFTSCGRMFPNVGECLLYPSKENRDWSKFKVEPKFPTNIDDCREINGLTYLNEMTLKLNDLRHLLSYRDAWWKVDNDWKPDWADSDTDKWVIECYYEVIKGGVTSYNRILAFRTKEIRDKFLETFGDLIEQCKELI